MAVIATDAFTRANENPLASPWTNPDSGGFQFQLVSNTASATPSIGNDQQAYYTGPTWPADQYSKAAITATGSGGAGAGGGVGVRWSGTNKTGYRLVVDTGGGIELASFSAGVFGLIWTRSVTFVNGAVLELQIQGTTLVAIYNGSAVGASATDATLSTGKPGITYSSTLTTCTIDNWEGGDFTSGASDQLDWQRNRDDINRIMRNYDVQIING